MRRGRKPTDEQGPNSAFPRLNEQRASMLKAEQRVTALRAEAFEMVVRGGTETPAYRRLMQAVHAADVGEPQNTPNDRN
jgi:hypothetical protein